ncbi:porin [Thioalkalivibrio sp. ALgr3]|uniref:porin n=1 Tax=Thioalkalivibrio sp. ALgr3 TaxID=1239292 RepID=UPI0004775703|nr:porin [Thioalkalivibrio sp. ALgr3]
MMNRKMLAAAVAATLAAPGMAMAQEEGAGPIDWDFYGSLRLQYEAADPDNNSSYDGFRDAYTRVGFMGSMEFNEGLSAFAQLELPLDLANGRVQDPFNGQDEDVRIGKIGIESDVAGTFAYGRDWLPYYNAIAFPVDMFNSFQSGFITYAAFRESDTLFYYSPDFNGFSFGGAYVTDGANDDNPYQLTGSYSLGDTTFSVGVQDANADERRRDWGFSVMHTMGDLYIGAKAETVDSADDDVDGDNSFNVFASYDWGQHTFKGMLATMDTWGGDVAHLGYDYHVNDALTFFAEYYRESESDDIGSGAIGQVRARDMDEDEGVIGDTGDVFMAGMHYSF